MDWFNEELGTCKPKQYEFVNLIYSLLQRRHNIHNIIMLQNIHFICITKCIYNTTHKEKLFTQDKSYAIVSGVSTAH